MRKLSVADYFVELLLANEIKDVFCYQGGMVAHFFDSFGNYKDQLSYHVFANEQGAAIAACAYAQTTNKPGVVITTSGPGFTNAMTGLANAWFDSLPVVLISGQVNTKDKRRALTIRQYGFQEIQTCEIVKAITKKTYEIDDDTDIKKCLIEALSLACEDRKGPVFLDFPINIERKIISVKKIPMIKRQKSKTEKSFPYIKELLEAERPLIIAGAGIKQSGMTNSFRELVSLLKVPVITTLPAIDLLSTSSKYSVGYMGGTARRESGIVLANADYVLTLGTRLCNKAIGYNHEQFVPKAKKIVRIDIDASEFERRLKDVEVDVFSNLKSFFPDAIKQAKKIYKNNDHTEWIACINTIKRLLKDEDLTIGNKFVREFTKLLPSQSNIILDVGNNLVYGAQSSIIKKQTEVFLSAGLGAMGYAIPAAIGAYHGNQKRSYVITGDGGAQMNIQELNIISRMHLPIKIIVLNNKALGHIILFQNHYLNGRLIGTDEDNHDYFSCDFARIAEAYNIQSCKIQNIDEIGKYQNELLNSNPFLIEYVFRDNSMLPNIHGGCDPLKNGPAIPDQIIKRINGILRSSPHEQVKHSQN